MPQGLASSDVSSVHPLHQVPSSSESPAPVEQALTDAVSTINRDLNGAVNIFLTGTRGLIWG